MTALVSAFRAVPHKRRKVVKSEPTAVLHPQAQPFPVNGAFASAL
jgi:hypothetical protein